MESSHDTSADPQPDWALLLPRDVFYEIEIGLRMIRPNTALVVAEDHIHDPVGDLTGRSHPASMDGVWFVVEKDGRSA